MGKTVPYLRQIICLPIRFYQLLISPCLLSCCRFYPSCSDYALSAIQEWGIITGIWKACLRLLRCHPWSEGGFDPVLPNQRD